MSLDKLSRLALVLITLAGLLGGAIGTILGRMGAQTVWPDAPAKDAKP
jgi:hypothetical protein